MEIFVVSTKFLLIQQNIFLGAHIKRFKWKFFALFLFVFLSPPLSLCIVNIYEFVLVTDFVLLTIATKLPYYYYFFHFTFFRLSLTHYDFNYVYYSWLFLNTETEFQNPCLKSMDFPNEFTIYTFLSFIFHYLKES